MYKIRQFQESDIEFVQSKAFILGLEIQYDKDYAKENVFTVINREDEVVGVGALAYHNTWYDERLENDHKLVLEYCLEEAHEAAFSTIITGAKSIYSTLKAENPKKRMSMISFSEAHDLQEVQCFLHNGFCFGDLIPVLRYDLTKEVKHYEVPNGIVIKPLELTKKNVEAYIQVTGIANNGVADSIAEIWFRSGDENFKTFAAYDGEQIVGGISIWNIGEDRGATENIFTIPEYRKRNIASELIATAFEELKARDLKYATLSMIGSNAEAMKLYQKIGYELMYYLVEVKYETAHEGQWHYVK